jgi:hypothetical protein
MDWNDLRNQVSNLSVYDLKAGVRKVQNGMYTGAGETRASTDTAASRHELHRNGVQGARGDQQRAMGSLVQHDAGDRKRHSQLVRRTDTAIPPTSN